MSNKTIAIMQPYFLPYIGYWQLLSAVDEFVVYDNIEFTKKGWINRNRILLNGKDYLITLPLKKDSDYLCVNERYISDQFNAIKTLNYFNQAYKKSPYFESVFPLIDDILKFDNLNLFDFIYHSINTIKTYLNIDTKIIKSSELGFNIQDYKSQDKVIKICEDRRATNYINLIGGKLLYNKDVFLQHNLTLQFINTEIEIYKQFKNNFIPNLSIIDMMMFLSVEDIQQKLNKYNLS